MKSLLKLLLGGFFCISASFTFSQQATISTDSLAFPDSSYTGYTDTVLITVKNLDTTTYSGSIFMWFATSKTNYTPVQFCFIQQITLQPNGSVQQGCNIIFDSTNFNAGNNIVVVWSSGNAKLAADSVWTTVFLDSTGASVHETANTLSFSVYPSIATNFVHVELSKQKIFLETIRILDVFGKEIMSFAVRKNEKKNLIAVSSLSSGIYFLEVSSGNLRNTRKFVKID